MSSSKKTKNAIKAAKQAPKKTEWNNMYKTTYYWWRFWLKNLLIKGKIRKYRFVKDTVGYTGHIAIDKSGKNLQPLHHLKKLLNSLFYSNFVVQKVTDSKYNTYASKIPTYLHITTTW